jgi:hypothetical protein
VQAGLSLLSKWQFGQDTKVTTREIHLRVPWFYTSPIGARGERGKSSAAMLACARRLTPLLFILGEVVIVQQIHPWLALGMVASNRGDGCGVCNVQFSSRGEKARPRCYLERHLVSAFGVCRHQLHENLSLRDLRCGGIVDRGLSRSVLFNAPRSGQKHCRTPAPSTAGCPCL